MSSRPKPSGKHRARSENAPSLVRQRSSASSTTGLIYMEFEISGKVQGVHFRKYTRNKAKELGLRGWVQNTEHGTVVGCIEGQRLKIDMMKDWLRRTGSPKSTITATEFKNIKLVEEHSLEDFVIVK